MVTRNSYQRKLFHTTFLALSLGGLIGMAGRANADTITVHDLSHMPGTGVYTYTVQLDAAADVLNNDGFVIYDFAGLTSWSLSGGLGSSQFALTQTPISNTLTDSTALDALAKVTAITNAVPVGNLSIDNLSFSYLGPPVPLLGATTALLTLTSVFTSDSQVGVYVSVDHSGGTAGPYGNAEGPIDVPGVGVGSGTPLPPSLFEGGLLFALMGGYRVMMRRRALA